VRGKITEFFLYHKFEKEEDDIDIMKKLYYYRKYAP
jgi:hypothetical protein